MPLTKSGVDVLRSMKKTYKDPKKAESVFYASRNKGIPGSNKWEGNPSIESPSGEHIASIHAHMEHIGNSMNSIADHIDMLKDIRARQKKLATPKI